MAQNEQQIIDILLELKRSSDSNAQSFDSLLSRINAKLDFTDNKPTIDLLRTYIKELTTSVEDKYTTTQNKFSDIEKALKAVYTLQGEQIKNSEIQELFDIFSKSVSNFAVEAKQNKAVLTGIESKISDFINNKTDKEDILRTISLLRKDFENVNNVYKHTIDDVNSNLKTIISGLIKLDPLKTNEAVKNQIDVMFNAISGIVMQLQNFDKKQIALEHILSQLATGEDLKITKGIIDEIIEKTTDIEYTVKNLANKSDITDLKEEAKEINKKVLTKEDIANLVKQTDDMLNNAEDIKNALGQMTTNIEQKPDSDIIENSLKTIYKKMDSLTQNISAANVKGDIFDVSTRLTSIKDELYTIKNIVTDLTEVVNTKIIDTVDSISEEDKIENFKDNISEMLNQLPTKEDIEKVLSDNNDVLKELVTKTSYIAENIGSIPAVIEKVEAIKESQNDLSEDIATSLSKLNFEKEFSCIYDKTNSIENWLEKSNIKENSEKMVRQMEKHTEQSDMTALNTQIEGIVKNLEDLSQSRDIGKVGNNITDIGSKIDNLTKLVKNLQKDDSVNMVSRLADIESKVSHIASVEDFSSFINEIRRCIVQLGSGHDDVGNNLSDIKNNQSNISERLSNLDFSEVTNFLDGKFSDLEKNIASILDSNEEIKRTSQDLDEGMDNLTSYIKSNLPVDTEYLERQMAEIKDIIESKVIENYKERNKSEDTTTIGAIEQYTKEIREILDNQPCVSVKEELSEKISNIETHIINCKEFNENAFLQVLNKIDEFEENAHNSISEENNLSSYMDELSELKEQVLELGQELKESEYRKQQIEDAKTDERISAINDFIAEKIEELSKNFETLTGKTGNKLQDKFSYNAELLEAKAAEIIKFIDEAKTKGDNHAEFTATLEDTSAKLADFKQELELISTDITAAVNQQGEKLVEEFTPIKEILLNHATNSDLSEIKTQISELHDELVSENELSGNTDKLNSLYTKVKEKLTQSENNLKDFILSDTDSIILKLDGMKELVEKSLSGFAPVPSSAVSKNTDISSFIKELDDFKKEYGSKLDNVLDLVNAAGLEQQNIASLIQDGIYKQENFAASIEDALTEQGNVANLVKEGNKKLEELVQDNIDAQQELSKLVNDKFEEQVNTAAVIQENSEKTKEIGELVKSSIDKQNDFNTQIDEEFSSQKENLANNHEELKSLLAVALNHDDIILAIGDLREAFEDKLSKLHEISDSLKDDIHNQNNYDMDAIVDDLKDTFARYSVKIDKLSMKNVDIESVLDTISNKIDDLLMVSAKVMDDKMNDNADDEISEPDFDFIQAFDLLQNDITELKNTIKKSVLTVPSSSKDGEYDEDVLARLSAKVDVVMQSLDSNDTMLDSFGYRLEELINSLNDGNNTGSDKNIDKILNNANKNWLSDIKNYLDDSNINSMLKAINEKLDILATSDGSELLEDISYTLNDVDSNIVPAVQNLSESDKKITSMLETLNDKINNVLSGGNGDISNIDDIKSLILEQKDYINKLEPSQGIDTFKKCLDELSSEVNNLSTNANTGNEQLKTSLHEMKDSIMAAVVAIFDQVSFVEESEDIKDFVEERTNEINKNIENITKQLKQLTSEEDNSYTYSMQDVETDLSKLRLALKEIQEGSGSGNNLTDELSEITTKLKEVATSVDSMSQDEIRELKSEISSLKEQTRFLIATSDKSYNALNSGLDGFGEIIQDNLAGKVDTVTKMLEKSEASDNVIKQALLYMGEWIDSTSESINKIEENSEGIETLTKVLDLKKFEKRLAKLDDIEEQFAQQDERIDRLEKNLDKVLSAIENLEDSSINRKIDKIEKQISKLSTNIEKLTSYVDD